LPGTATTTTRRLRLRLDLGRSIRRGLPGLARPTARPLPPGSGLLRGLRRLGRRLGRRRLLGGTLRRAALLDIRLPRREDQLRAARAAEDLTDTVGLRLQHIEE